MTDNEPTVYVNDNPIGDTEVYHRRKSHATNLRRWRDRYIKELSESDARAAGLRPCQQCFPAQTGRYCPGCGFSGIGDGTDDSRVCDNAECRVERFSETPDL